MERRFSSRHARIGVQKIAAGLLGVCIALHAVLCPAAQSVSFYGFDEAAYSPTAREGMEEIFAGRLFHASIPAAAARLAFTMTGSAQKSAGFTPGSTDGRFYASGRLPSPPTRTAGVDPGFALGESAIARNQSQHLTINCFMCHAGVVNGQVVAGMANNHINQSDPRNVRTRGDNFGPYAVWRLGARLDDPASKGLTLASKTTELEKIFDSTPLPPVDPMPWWLMKYKKKDYWYADAAPTDAGSFSINFTTPHAEMNEHHLDHVQSVAKALAFARETQSPAFPGKLDAQLVERGADLFHGRMPPLDTTGFRACKTCHGSYTRKDNAGDLSAPGSWNVDYDFSHVLRNVKTDPTYNATLQKLKPIADHINKLETYMAAQGVPPESIPHASVPAGEGYVAPPLVGVWASAPYFHNGSVPTIAAVLNSAARPESWARNHEDPFAYDLEQVGMAYKPVSRAEFDDSAERAKGKPFAAQAAIDHGAIYDTTAFGHANTGHTFGDHLSPEERRAIIEFLKSLSGPDM
jgi:mono/diheme cytochrome c family protein